jgi:hypothetical protein
LGYEFLGKGKKARKLNKTTMSLKALAWYGHISHPGKEWEYIVPYQER